MCVVFSCIFSHRTFSYSLFCSVFCTSIFCCGAAILKMIQIILLVLFSPHFSFSWQFCVFRVPSGTFSIDKKKKNNLAGVSQGDYF